MKKYIKFTDFIIERGFFSCKVIRNLRNKVFNDNLYLAFQKYILLDNNDVAIILAIFCCKYFDEIEIDLALDEDIFNRLSLHIDGILSCKKLLRSKKEYNNNNNRITLNFSGGLDSYAVYLLLTENILDLAAITFGGKFNRETRMFQQFHPYTLVSNFRSIHLSQDNINFNFMGIASIIYNKILNNKFYCYGSVLEATKAINPIDFRGGESFPFNMLDMQRARFSEALTEIGTMKIVAYKAPEKLNESLNSIEVEGSVKKYRKNLIAKVLKNKYDFDYSDIKLVPPDKKLIFGQHFADDFLALYLNKYDNESINKLYQYLPDEFHDLSQSLSLSFYEKFNPKILIKMNNLFKTTYEDNLISCDIAPYNKSDFQEINKVEHFLLTYSNN